MTGPAKIFMVEDHAPDVFLFRKALRDNQVEFHLTRFENGEQAVQALLRLDELPDLFILDLNVPKIDGLDLLRLIRKDPSMASVPIAILTSSRADQDKQDAMALGANCFITN